MKNIINVDFQNTINSGMYCVANDTNTLDLCLTPSLVQKTNYRVEVTDTNNIVHTSKAIGLNANDQIKYQVSNAYYNGNGVMKIRLLSNESNSDYIIFNCVEFTTEDLICKYANGQYNFSVKKVNPLDLPIATKEKLGAVIVGDGLEVDTAGKITANGANNYSLPTASASTLGGVKVGTNLSISNGVLSAKDTTYGVMRGATASADGASGLVPAPTKGNEGKYLKGDGSWGTPAKTIVDDTLSDTSTNPVQNKIVKGEIDRAKNIADQSMTLAGNLANALMYEMAINDSGFIFKGTGGTTYMLYKDLTSFVDLSPYAKKADIVGTYKYKGSVDTASVLPTSGQTTGDVYNIVASSSYGPAGCNVAWNGEAWDSLGGIFTITSISNSELDTICV